MAADPEIIDRLDRIHAILSVAFAAELNEFRDRIRSDTVNAAILDAADDWVLSSDLQERVARQLSISTRSVRDRFPALVAEGVLQPGGSEARPQYRATGLI
jgi:hypothetical protein